MTEPGRVLSRSDLLKDEVGKRVRGLQRAFLDPGGAENAEAVATLARLRRCSPDELGTDPAVWEVTLGELPNRLQGSNEPSPAERALHASLVLYAFHQQSNSVQVHRSGIGLGRAVQTLATARGREGKPDESCIRRLHQVVLAGDPSGRLYHLRGLISLMRSEAEPVALDYASLAVDLWRLFDPKQDSDRVLTAWGRDLHNRPRTQPTGESE
jgi:CRISPR system Cascade subunit CasB